MSHFDAYAEDRDCVRAIRLAFLSPPSSTSTSAQRRHLLEPGNRGPHCGVFRTNGVRDALDRTRLQYLVRRQLGIQSNAPASDNRAK